MLASSVLGAALVLASFAFTNAGSVWPKPQNQTNSNHVFYISKNFDFEASGFKSDILKSAFSRYQDLLFDFKDDNEEKKGIASPNSPSTTPPRRHESFVKRLKVHVALNDQSLGFGTDESYVLDISAPSSHLTTNTVFGALHGLETFSQLLDPVEDNDVEDDLDSPDPETLGEEALTKRRLQDWDEAEQAAADMLGKHKKHKHHKKHHHKHRACFSIRGAYIWDAPRFRHRGLLLDTARHFLPVSVILAHLDAMAWSKMNVFHWHIVDDQSFPFVSRSLPKLAEKGAFAADLVYSPEDVKKIVSYARDRGIRVVPEFDTPGHTLSWGQGYPNLLADCYDDQGKSLGTKGPINPARNSSYELLWTLLQEIAENFPDSYIHLGGDEVPFNCWQNNPEIKQWMARQDPQIQDMRALEEYFERQVLDLAAIAGRSYIVWQEILDNGVQIQNDTVVHVWKWWWPTISSEGKPQTQMQNKSRSLTADRKFALFSNAKDFIPHLKRLWHGLLKAAIRSTNLNLEDRRGSHSVDRKLSGQVAQFSTAIPADLAHGGLSGSSEAASFSKDQEEPPAWTHELEFVTGKVHVSGDPFKFLRKHDSCKIAQTGTGHEGYRALLSSPWYLNLGGFASNDWAAYYSVEPLAFEASSEQKELVIGGEACVWGEFVDETNSLQRTWPNAAAVAERLWSNASVRNHTEAASRLAEHRCRLVRRGVAAEPLGPGFCL